MSAFVVSKEHIDAMLAAGLRHKPYPTSELSWFATDPHGGDWEYGRDIRRLDHTTADAVGQMLWSENVASVEHRYSPPGREQIYGEGFESAPDFALPGTYREEVIPGTEGETIELPEWITEYRFPLTRARCPEVVEALKLIECLEYQSCEHDGWNDSEARRFCDALRGQLISALPGYADAEWSA